MIHIAVGLCHMAFEPAHAKAAAAVLLHWSGLMDFHTAANIVIGNYAPGTKGGTGTWLAREVLSRLSACKT